LSRQCLSKHAENWSDPQWTKTINLLLGRLGRSFGCSVYGKHLEELKPEHGEWLYDLVWLQERHGKSFVPLILECEWSKSDMHIDHDFEKLMVGRAEHRVMICCGSDVDRQFKRLADKVRAFGHTQAGDRYLFLGLNGNGKFKSHLFIA
jgi:hypothetical protein